MASTVAAGAVGSSAGCLSMLPPASQQIRYGTVEVPGDRLGEPWYREWLPADSELPALEYADGVEDLGWIAVTPGDLGRRELGVDFSIGRAVVQAAIDFVGYGIESYDRLVGLDDLGAVVETDVDRETVRETLDSTGYEPAGTYEGYDRYDRTDDPRLIAVGDEALVHARGENRAAKAETVIDAGAGRIDRRYEVDDAFRAYTDWIGSAPTVLDGFGLLEDAVFSGLAYTFDDEAAYFSHRHRFEPGSAPTEGEVKTEINDVTRGQQASLVDVTVDDPRVEITLRMTEHAWSDGADRSRLPFVTWGVDHGEETVTVRHEAGEAVPVDKIDIQPSGALREPPAAGTLLEPGDALAFAIDELGRAETYEGEGGTTHTVFEESIRIVYEYEGGSSSVLFHYDPDQNETET